MGRGSLGILCLGVLGGCSAEPDLPPLEIFSERVAIAVIDEHPPCAGDLAALDTHVREVERLSGFSGAETIDVYLGSVDERCRGFPMEFVQGCYRHGLDAVFSPWGVVHHEIAHAVARDFRFDSRFWSEGFAEVASGVMSQKSELEVLTTEQLSDRYVFANYVSTGHLARYLVETRGWGAYRAVLERGSEAGLGLTEEALFQEYEREAPAAYPPRPSSCDFPELETDGGDWSERFRFSCEASEATQYEYLGRSASRGAAVIRSVELDAGTYEMESMGGDGFILVGCLTDVLDVLPDEPPEGDLDNEVDHWTGQFFPSGVRHRISVTRGQYRVALSSGTEAEAAMEFHIRRVD